MSPSASRQRSVFGKRSEPHTIIIARGNTIRHFTIRPWIAALIGSGLAAIAIGYLVATSYLVLRDDLLNATVTRQARMQQAYEDRISALRAQVDRINSRQLLDQQLMENKVTELLNRQAVLSKRHGLLSPLVERSSDGNSELPAKAPLPEPRPDRRASADSGETSDPLAFAGTDPITTGAVFDRILGLRENGHETESVADRADRTFLAINKSLRSIEIGQMEKIRSMVENAYQTADEISAAFAKAGLKIEVETGDSAAGGPLIAADPAMFDNEINQLDEALKMLEEVRDSARRLPIANPMPGRTITSSFGMRRDPILGTRAFHSGMDFRASSGDPVRATGAGKVISAGWNGGYGRMVEIDHGRGVVTRYGHMKKIAVKKGEHVDTGTVIGRAGSSGRSTGTHLHYEVRRNGRPANPLKFIAVGKEVYKYL